MAAIHGKNYGNPTLDLNFAGNKSLVDSTTGTNYVTFSRAQSGNEATYVGSDGLIKYASADEARFDHDPVTGECLGLLIEESRTNLITDSSSANNWNTLGGGTTAVSTSICPDGSTDGTRVTAVALNDGASKTFSAPTSGIHKGTYYARTRTGVSVDVKVAISGLTGPKVTLPADGTWVRVEGPLNNLGAGSKYLSIRSDNASMDIDVWGLQAELGEFQTSYIPTTGSTVTRAADVASITGTNFSSWYNQSEGTIFTSVRTMVPKELSNGFFMFTDGTVSNRIEFHQAGSGDTVPRVQGLFRYLNSTTTQFLNREEGWSTDGKDLDNWCLSFDNTGYTFKTKYDSTPATGTGNYPQNLNNLSIGHKGTISRLSYYPKRLPDIELQQLTK